ncbi:MAG: PAS domain-containing protein, partial [Methylococcus sp.]
MNNSLVDYQQELARMGETIRVLQEELAETNQGLVALSMELEQRVDQRTAELQDAQAELKRTNSELLILTMELEDRVAQRTEELSRTLAALREAEDRTAFALGVTHIGTLDLALADATLRTSAVFDRILGYDNATPDWTYDRFLGHVLPEDRERVEQSYQEMLQRQADWNVECRIHSRDAQIRWIRIHGRIRVDEQT